MNVIRWLQLYLLPCVIVVSQSQHSSSLKKFIDTLPNNKGSAVYGPRKECRMKYEILDPRNIEATQQEIINCHGPDINCNNEGKSKFRTLDGSCNNLQNPSWGKSNLCLRRILPFDYSDNVSHPRESCSGNPLPNPRLVSIVYHNEISSHQVEFTTHFMEWGQMLAHDLSLNDFFRRQLEPNGPLELIPCCNNEPHICDLCYSLAIPPNDPFFPRIGITCINFIRSVPCNICSTKKRVHWNQNTAYHDLSLVYGSNEENAQKLRSWDRGMLSVEYNRRSGPMPPTVYAEDLCVSQRSKNACYKTGDPRSNQTPFILTVQTYLLRHHNFICQELNEINPHWDDERIYQEARRINIAIAQYISYGIYLPFVLGDLMQEYGIGIDSGATFTQYKPDLDASIIDEFTTIAARYGHTLVPGRISEIDPRTEERNEIRLKDYFYTPFNFKNGQFEKIAKGMTEDRMYKHDVFLSDDIRNYLFRRLYMTHLNQTTGTDLAALSILRGRDHGIPGYTYYQRHFFNSSINNFNDLRKILPPEKVDLLESLYESVHDVDTYSASLAENYVRGGFVGRTFGTVLGEQYRRLKFGDRYWFEHGGQVGSFTPEQLMEIKRMTLARILCETTRMEKIQMQVFLPPSDDSNPVVSCNEIHRLDFNLWKE